MADVLRRAPAQKTIKRFFTVIHDLENEAQNARCWTHPDFCPRIIFNIDPEKSLLIEKTVRQSKIDLHICPRSRFGEIYSGLFARRGSIIGWHWSVMIWDTLKVNKVGKNGVSFRAYSFLLFSQSPIPSRSNHTLECATHTHTHRHTHNSLSLFFPIHVIRSRATRIEEKELSVPSDIRLFIDNHFFFSMIAEMIKLWLEMKHTKNLFHTKSNKKNF